MTPDLAGSSIEMTVRLFAGVRDRAGTRSLTVSVPSGGTVDDALSAAAAAVPGELRVTSSVMLALNGEYVEGAELVSEGDELALIPPVSGGAVELDASEKRVPDTFDEIVITEKPLDERPLTEYVTTDEDGAVLIFHGVTRNHNDGRKVLWLEYEAYQPMAEKKIAEIIAEMKEKWEIRRVAIAHRTGRVDIGETSMVLAVGAAHRRPAYEASLHFIDRLKQIVPIWKKEYFEGGEAWVGDTPGGGPGASASQS